MRYPFAALLAAVLLAGFVVPAGAQDLPATGLLDFTVLRKGEEVGYHRVSFRRDGEITSMSVEAQVEVTFLGLVLFRFRHRGSETWANGRLVAFETETDDDGDQAAVTVRRNGADDFEVKTIAGTELAPGDSIPSSLWRLGILEMRVRDELLHTITGALLPMTVSDLGRKEIETGEGPTLARGFFVDARPDFHRELWYDERGLLAAARLTGPDGATVELIRQRPVEARE